MEDYNRIYPQLSENGDPLNFRLQKSCEILQNLEKEVKQYECVQKKYNRLRKLIVWTTGGVSVLLSGTGLALSLTGFGAAVGVPIGGVGALLGVVSTTVGVKLSRKIAKHEKTSQLARAKVNTLQDIISKSLADNKISDTEFEMVIAESTKYNSMKQEIRQKSRKETEKNLDMSQIRKEIRTEIIKELTAPAR